MWPLSQYWIVQWSTVTPSESISAVPAGWVQGTIYIGISQSKFLIEPLGHWFLLIRLNGWDFLLQHQHILTLHPGSPFLKSLMGLFWFPSKINFLHICSHRCGWSKRVLKSHLYWKLLICECTWGIYFKCAKTTNTERKHDFRKGQPLKPRELTSRFKLILGCWKTQPA